MPTNVFGSTCGSTENKIDTSSYVQKPRLRIKNFQTKIEEDNDIKHQ